MSIWKSPVFYFGVLLLLAVSAALIAPFVVDWNRYKSDLEVYGERLSGRNVQINGPVSVRLFPFPRLQAEFVDLGNTDDPAKGTFANAERVVLKVALDGLFAGELRVDEITFEKPVFDLQRRRDGSVNWIIEPQENLRNSPLLDQVRLDRVTLSNATIRLTDEQRLFSVALEDVTATLSAAQITGPWRSVGSGTVFGQRTDFVFTSSVFSPTEPLRMGLKLSPQDKTWPNLAFDGAVHNREVTGKLRLDPTVDDNENNKGNLEGRIRPLALQADFAAKSDSAELNNIRITPSDSTDGSTLIEGDVKAQVTDRIVAAATFEAARLNLDAVFGAESLSIWRTTGLLGLVEQVIGRFPERLDLKTDFKANVLTVAQETLENVEISAELASGNVRLRRVSANLPGRSRILADGIAFSGQEGTEFGGKMALESNDLRLFTGWLWPSVKPWIASHWTGSRGQLKLQGNLDWSGKRLTLRDAAFELDGAGGNATVTQTQADNSALGAEINLSSIDLDSYFPNGIAVTQKAGQLTWYDVVQAMVSIGHSRDAKLLLAAKTLSLNKVVAQDVSMTAAANGGTLTLESFSIGAVGSAEVTAKGSITESGGMYDGALTAGLSAEDPNRFLRLIGLASQTTLAPWQKVLGRTDATAKLIMQKGENEPQVSLEMNAESGPVKFAVTADMSALASPDGVKARGVAEVSSADGTQLVRLFGLDPQPVIPSPGKLRLAFDGQPKTGYTIDSKLEAFAASLGFSGTYLMSAMPIPGLAGHLSLSADDPQSVFRAIGIPVEPQAGNLRVAMNLEPQVEALLAEDITGELGGKGFAGSASYAANGTISADLNGGVLSFADISAPALMQWLGTPATLESNFSNASPLGLQGEIWLRPESLNLVDALNVTEAVVGLQFKPSGRMISLAGRTPQGGNVALDVTVTPAGNQFVMQVTGNVPLDLASSVKDEKGAPLLDGSSVLAFNASGTGLTPVAAVADATGNGTLQISGATLSKFAPEQFASRIQSVSGADDLRAAMATLQSNSAFALPDKSVPFSFSNGRVTLEPVVVSSPSTETTINGEADLVGQTVSATLQLKLKAPAGLPVVKLQVAGSPLALRQRLETSELAGKLGFEIMAREMAELERVQAEQQRALEVEKAQRLADEERYQSYLEQRAELRLRQRELKVHAAERKREAERDVATLRGRLEELAAMSKSELTRRIREQRIFRIVANGGTSKPVKSKRVEPQKLDEIPEGFVLPQTPVTPQDGLVPQ